MVFRSNCVSPERLSDNLRLIPSWATRRESLNKNLPRLLSALTDSGLSYSEIADTLNIPLNSVKNLRTGRAKKLRNSSVDRVLSNLRNVQMMNISDASNIIIDEIIGDADDVQASLGFAAPILNFFAQDREDLIEFSNRNRGRYFCYYFSGNGREVVKVGLEIGDYDERTSRIKSKLSYRTLGGRHVNFDILISNMQNSAIFFGFLEGERGVLSLVFDNFIDAKNEPNRGIFIFKQAGRRAFSARFLMTYNSRLPQNSTTEIGILDYDAAQNEIGEFNLNSISNKCDEYSVLKTFMDR